MENSYLFTTTSALIIQFHMGRKLRSRQILSDTEHEAEEEEHPLPLQGIVSPSSIRKSVKSKCCINFVGGKAKRNRFQNRVGTGAIARALTPHYFECPICLELMINPVMMICGHAYCYRCLESNAAHSQRCCLCRSEQSDEPYIPLPLAEAMVENFLLPVGPDLLRYLCRTTQSAEWTKRRQSVSWKQGLVIDFQDSCRVWRRGVITKVLNYHSAEIKYSIKGLQFFQKVERSSRRIAPFTFFTRNRYLEDFPTTLPDHDPTQNEFSNIPYRKVWDQDCEIFLFGDSFNEGVAESGEGEALEQMEEALRIFKAEMNEIDSILNF